MAATCEEFEDHQDRTGELVILVGQSIVLGEVKAEVLLHDENPMNDQIIWQQYIQQVESLSPENRVSKFCKEAGFMRVAEVGQYSRPRILVILDNFNQWLVANTPFLETIELPQPKGWIQGNMRIGPVLEVTTSFQFSTSNMELKFELSP